MNMEILYSINFWLIVGFFLAILEIFSGLFIALCFSVASFLMAIVFWLWPNIGIEWYEIIFLHSFIGFSVASLTWLKLRRNQKELPDIND